MGCDEARRRMLTADPPELAGDGTGPLADHLGRCPACRERAAVLLDGQRELGRALAAMARGGEADPADGAASAAPGPRPRWVGGAVAAALAAAAAVLLWLGRGGGTWTGATDPVVEIGDTGSTDGFRLDVPPEGRVTVFRVDDPEIIVVWNDPGTD